MKAVANTVKVGRAASIDDLLGSAEGRFFGEGYKCVQHALSSITINSASRKVTAILACTYPTAWSTKQHKELSPHLSSIDALIAAVQLIEVYIRVAFNLQNTEKVWVERCTLRSGQSATTDLDSVPVSCTHMGTDEGIDSMNGARSRFQCQVGTIRVDFVVDHPKAVLRDVCNSWETVDEILGLADESYYREAYASHHLSLNEIEFDDSCERISAILGVNTSSQKAKHTGFSAAYYPFVSQITTIVGVAQLAQALLYRYDNLDRARTNNLWMRKIKLVSAIPAKAAQAMRVETWFKKLSLVSNQGQPWRVGEFQLSLPGVMGEYTLAHQLPEKSHPSI